MAVGAVLLRVIVAVFVSMIVDMRMIVGMGMIVMVGMRMIVMMSMPLNIDTLPEHPCANNGDRQSRYHAKNLCDLFGDDEVA